MDKLKYIFVFYIFLISCNKTNDNHIAIDPKIGMIDVVVYGQAKMDLENLYDKDMKDEDLYLKGSGGKYYTKIKCNVHFTGSFTPKVYSISVNLSDFDYINLVNNEGVLKIFPHSSFIRIKNSFIDDKTKDNGSLFEIVDKGLYISHDSDKINTIIISDLDHE